MFKPLSIFIGLRYVRSRQGNGFSSFISASSTLGIALGTMVLIVVLSTMNGFERELSQKLLSIVPHAELITVNQPIDNWQQSVESVKKHPKVLAAAPVIKMTGMLQHKMQLKALEVRGVDTNLEAQVSSISDYIIEGDWSALSPNFTSSFTSNEHPENINRTSDYTPEKSMTNGIIIGAGVAKKLSVKLGDKVQLLLPHREQATTNAVENANINKVKNNTFPVPIKRHVTVVGIFKFGGTIDDSLAYISLQQAANIMEYSDNQAQGIRLKLSAVFEAPRIAREVAYSFDYYSYIYDWTRTQGHVYNDIQLVRMVMFIALVLVIAVASFNIVSTLIMAVTEKQGDIAILKTMGASSTTIMLTFIIQGLVNGVLGSIIGGLLGMYLALNLSDLMSAAEKFFNTKFLSADVYFIDYLPSYLQMTDVYITVATALIMSLLATIYPAWRATKVEPAQVLGQL